MACDIEHTMNKTPLQDNQVGWLLLDLNSFFASCEQQEQAHLRGKPIIVVPMMSDGTCAIAASYEAKKFGIKTGTKVWEAKQRCPGLIVVQARHKIYTAYHHKIIAAVDTCIPVEKVLSVDEMACRLEPQERNVEVAKALAHKIKRVIKEQVGECLTCSIGLAPNMFLAKVASDMQKPNGLTVITKNDLPQALYKLKLIEICGIGRAMEKRLNHAGIWNVPDLMACPRGQMRLIWGGAHGVLFHELLRGADLQLPSSGLTQSMSHQHVLEPKLRTMLGAMDFSHHLLAKAAERLRKGDYYCSRLMLHVSFKNNEPNSEINQWGNWAGWGDETSFPQTQETNYLMRRLRELWEGAMRPPYDTMKPLKVGVVLCGLVPKEAHQPDLFAPPEKVFERPLPRPTAPLNHLVDEINARYGRHTIGFGVRASETRGFTGHAAFQRVPLEWEY